MKARRSISARVARCAGLLVLGTWLGCALAQPTGIALSTYDGTDRAQRLIEGAKKEGDVVVYTSAPADDIKALADLFEQKYGIKAKIWRASADKVLQRATSEARAKRFEADVFETDAPALEGLVRESLLTAVRSPAQDELVPEARFAHQAFVRSRFTVYALAYNTKNVHKADLPRGYEGLLDARWKGKLGIEADDGDWFAALSQTLGEAKTQKLFRDVVAKNGVVVRHGHGYLAELVAAGDVPLAITVYTGKVEQLKRKGAPIEWFVLPPAAIARASGVAVAARAVHPHAALLWYDFELSEEAQKLLAERGYVPANRKVASAERTPLRFIDAKTVLDEGEKWDKRYAEIFGSHRPEK